MRPAFPVYSLRSGFVTDVGGGDANQMERTPAVYCKVTFDIGNFLACIVALLLGRAGVFDALGAAGSFL